MVLKDFHGVPGIVFPHGFWCFLKDFPTWATRLCTGIWDDMPGVIVELHEFAGDELIDSEDEAEASEVEASEIPMKPPPLKVNPL